MALVPCLTCSRHVRASELACPFCGSARQASDAPEPLVLRSRSRSGVMNGVMIGAVVVSAALIGSACATYGGGPAWAYDAGPPDAGTDAH